MKTINNSTLNELCHFLSECDNFVFLDTSKPTRRNSRSLLFIEPLQRLQFYNGEDEEQFLATVQTLQRQGHYIAGWFAYEFGYLLEPSLCNLLRKKSDRGALLADLGVFESCYFFDHITGETSFPLQENFEAEQRSFAIQNLRLSQSHEKYLQAIHTILDYIRAGDTYQVNYTLKLFFDFIGSPEKFYTDLRRNQSVSYGAYIRWDDRRVMSFSPELFFWKNETDVMVRPMKGTMKRGRTLAEDGNYRHFLQNDVKNQSENVMIVDLLRNDLGRLMHHTQNGSVEVDSLFDVETYETLLQMTSTITGRADRDFLSDVSLYNFFKAIFPCGSVTGAPKIRTMEIIDELEDERRGVYTGAIGYMAPDGKAVFNVPIRTVVLEGSRGEMGIGSGIVHDSDPDNEWKECQLKGRFLTSPHKEFFLIETFLWQLHQGYWLLDRHLGRLKKSAEYFLFQCDVEKISVELDATAKSFCSSAMRVRLQLGKDGNFTLQVSTCKIPESLILPERPDPLPADLPNIRLSSKSMNSASCWYYHKTSNRDLYDGEFHSGFAQGFFDTIFTNEHGQITEGCISNIIIYKNGSYFTPPLTDGLLAGVMRQFLLDDSPLSPVEMSLSIEDVKEAEAIFLCNSVRGVVQVSLGG